MVVVQVVLVPAEMVTSAVVAVVPVSSLFKAVAEGPGGVGSDEVRGRKAGSGSQPGFHSVAQP